LSIRSANNRRAIRPSTACPIWTGCAVYGSVIDGGVIHSGRMFMNHRSSVGSSASGSIDAVDASGSIRLVANNKPSEQDHDCEYNAFHVNLPVRDGSGMRLISRPSNHHLSMKVYG
jgi:hypothetical protein